MFFTKFIAASVVVVGLSSSAYAHAAAHPAMGIKEPLKRPDVRRPDAKNPCGTGVDIAANLEKAETIQVAADGTFSVVVENYNGGIDGSRQFTLKVDATGTGKSFQAGTITKNGLKVTYKNEKETIQAKLPAGMICQGGQAANLCLAQFTNAAYQKFGNCVVVSMIYLI
ncbi:hypothetical protein PLEOSDRAFT_1050167 [Pleurotus ostreatus PC15]|uniref:Uncharacterized protein n=1 Tax=Pleurotus ostreatus (strain PC15) TaxID=1137138 RepID=A0A067N6T3_PLEO1|nr:hypothetical protein PLEOSDRAFT_1050167 [Pleurotus ostreatus PC15]